MKITTVKRMQECFAGKVCTVMTRSSCKSNFTEAQFTDYFTGIVESLDEDGLFVRHHITGCKSFFPMDGVVAILEEQTVTQDDPNFKKVAEEFDKVVSQSKPRPTNPSPYVDQDLLASLAKQARS